MEVQILEDYPVSFGAAVFSASLPSLWEISSHLSSGFRREIGRAASSLHLLASIYLFAHPRGHVIALQWTANT